MSDLMLTYRGAVYPWHCDQMGHMNVMWYVGKFDEATWNLFAAMGVTCEVRRRKKPPQAATRLGVPEKACSYTSSRRIWRCLG